jgi:purine-binding chemotaxis protein CheW
MIEAWQTVPEARQAEEQTVQYLCFWLGAQTYALPVGEVQEIRATGTWSTLPGSPPWVLGVMNLRGLVIPLFDLRVRFSIAAGGETSAVPVLIVVAAQGKLAGLVVDGVMDVTDIPRSSLRPANSGANVEARCVSGVASLDDSVVIILDAAMLMSWEADTPSVIEGPEFEGANDVAMVQ